MLKDFNKSQSQALTDVQKDQVKRTFDVIREVLKANKENSFKLKHFWSIPDNWNDYLWAHRKVYTDEGINKILPLLKTYY